MKINNIKFLNILYPQNGIVINCEIPNNNFFISNIRVHKVKNNETNQLENYLCLGDNCNFCMENIKNDEEIYPITEYFLFPIIVYPNSILSKNIKSKEENPFYSIFLLDSNNYNIFISSLKNLNVYGKLFISKINKNINVYNLIKNDILNIHNDNDIDKYLKDDDKFYFNFINMFKKKSKALKITFNNKKISVNLIDYVHPVMLNNLEHYSEKDVIDFILKTFLKVKNYNEIKNNN